MKRSTWVLLGIIAALALFILLFERKMPSSGEVKEQSSKLFPAKFKDVASLSRTGFQPVSLKSGAEESWNIVAPVADKADRYGVTGFTDELGGASVTRWVDDASLKDLGLEPPRATWTIEAKSGRATLEVGADAPLDAGLYVRANGKVALVPKSLEDTLLRPAGDFRSKELVASPEQDVTSFSMTSGGHDLLAFSRADGAWRVTAPFKDAGDGAKLQGILDDACLCPIDHVVEDNPADFSKYGLAPPDKVIKLGTKPGATVTVMLGSTVAGGDPKKALIYAYSSDRPSVFAVSSNSIKSLFQDPQELRSLALFARDPFDADRIEVKGAFNLAITKDAKGMWSLEKTAGAKPDNGPALFTALSDLKGTKAFAGGEMEALNLGQPSLTITVKGKGWEESDGLFEGKDGSCYARPKGRDVALAIAKDDWKTARLALQAASGK